MKKIFIGLLVFGFGLAVAQDYVMGINFDSGGKFDRSFNEGTWNGFSRAVNELSDEYDIEALEFEGSPDTFSQGLRAMSDQGADLIVAPGFLQADAISNVALEFPNTSYVIIDAVVEADNVRSVLFREQEGSYLVGYIAGTLSQTGVVGFIGGQDIPLIRAFGLGYETGVLAACPECTVISNFTGVTPAAWSDPARAKELATLQHGQGADIIYAAAGASGNGVIDFVTETMCYTQSDLPSEVVLRETPLTSVVAEIPKSDSYSESCAEGAQPIFFIGVDSNQNRFGDTDGDASTLNHGLTSMLKRVDVAAENAVYDVVNGEFTSGIQSLGLEEGGVAYAVDEYNDALITEGLRNELQSITDGIVAGIIEVPDYRTQ
ncbi:MAG: BMP family ABC transporter substrate-binding protein [Trueperaceae bacterium]|nr:BMP family ABC transporter substrate-binding protein [Trueperaceae bacterium]